jgi:transcriptional regulator with AAA-type ATPase domain
MYMPIFSTEDRRFAGALARLSYCNPFLPERIELERAALGTEFVDRDFVWSLRHDAPPRTPNVDALGRRAEAAAGRARGRLAAGAQPASDEEVRLYEDLVLYLLFHRTDPLFFAMAAAPGGRPEARVKAPFYAGFVRDAEAFLALPGFRLPALDDLPHLFACFFQIRRAFQHIFFDLIGGSLPAARLRAAAWQSIFTHDMRRYRRSLHARMGDVTTLICGPSGTGKELVARAIGFSRYIPFDPAAGAFADDFAASFHPLNLSALSPTLIESELFGHRRGAFTGAVADRTGWLEVCRPLGTVFLDEIGDVDPAIQVKLLRVLQTRTFQRLGDTETRRFSGKVVAATNRDLAQAMRAGRFREDFYYRLCADQLVTPSLREQLAVSPGELRQILLFIARRLAGDEAEAVAAETEAWIDANLGRDYPWPGNVRELEQCMSNVLIRKSYGPARVAPADPREALARGASEGALTVDELLRRYCTLVYAQAGSWQEAARRLGVDHRTVRSHVDETLLQEYRGGAGRGA